MIPPKPPLSRIEIKGSKTLTGGRKMVEIEKKEVLELAVDEAKVAEVSIVDFDMPIWSMVRFLLKLTFAAIPAAIIISAIVWLVMLAGMSILAVSR